MLLREDNVPHRCGPLAVSALRCLSGRDQRKQHAIAECNRYGSVAGMPQCCLPTVFASTAHDGKRSIRRVTGASPSIPASTIRRSPTAPERALPAAPGDLVAVRHLQAVSAREPDYAVPAPHDAAPLPRPALPPPDRDGCALLQVPAGPWQELPLSVVARRRRVVQPRPWRGAHGPTVSGD